MLAPCEPFVSNSVSTRLAPMGGSRRRRWSAIEAPGMAAVSSFGSGPAVLWDSMSTIDTTSALGSLLHEQRDQILEIAARHHPRNVRVFGSVARGEATETSDIDFLVDFDKDSSLFDVLHITEELETLLGREVDVVSTGGLKHRDDRIRAEAVEL